MPSAKPSVGDVFSTSPGHIVRSAARDFRRVLAHELDQAGISLSYYHFLRSLTEQDGLTQAELCARNAIDPASATTTLAKMERAGLIERVRDADDRRKINVFLTREGRKKRSAILRIITNVHTALLAS